jgi:hypothetical protein
MLIEPKNIDFSKYKRFFTFGCSFTDYRWPTWSNILKEEMPNIEYYNFGSGGAGNMLISNRIVEASLRFNFNENDLIIVMWSTFCREDRWITNRRWVNPGNIFSQAEYDDEFVQKYADSTGYLIRDMALITLSHNYLKYNNSDAISLMSVPIYFQQDCNSNTVKDVIKLYSSIINSMPGSLLILGMNGSWEFGHIYYNIEMDSTKLFKDYHPSPSRYCQYLLKIGFNLSESTINYAEKFTEILKSSTIDPKLRPEFDQRRMYSRSERF